MQVTECVKCHTMFNDPPETAGVCPRCGHENHFDDEDHIPARKVTG